MQLLGIFKKSKGNLNKKHIKKKKKKKDRDFPGHPVVKILHFHCMGQGFDPWSGIKIPQASRSSQIAE